MATVTAGFITVALTEGSRRADTPRALVLGLGLAALSLLVGWTVARVIGRHGRV